MLQHCTGQFLIRDKTLPSTTLSKYEYFNAETRYSNPTEHDRFSFLFFGTRIIFIEENQHIKFACAKMLVVHVQNRLQSNFLTYGLYKRSCTISAQLANCTIAMCTLLTLTDPNGAVLGSFAVNSE